MTYEAGLGTYGECGGGSSRIIQLGVGRVSSTGVKVIKCEEKSRENPQLRYKVLGVIKPIKGRGGGADAVEVSGGCVAFKGLQ